MRSLLLRVFDANRAKDLCKMVDNQHVSFSGELVDASPGDPAGLKASVGDGHVAIPLAMPEVDGHRDVLQLEAPVPGEEGEVLC